MQPYIVRRAVLDDTGAWEAILTSWDFLKKNFLEILVIYLLLMALGIALGIGMICSGAGAPGTVLWGSVFQCPPSTGPIFMQKLPKDPLNSGLSVYFYTGGFPIYTSTNTYILSAQLENTGDPEISTGCNMGNHNYCVTNP